MTRPTVSRRGNERTVELAASIFSSLATRAPNEPEWSSARKRFWELYWGELGVVESPEVGSAMVAFGQNLRSIEKCVDDRKGCDGMQEPLAGKALGLAHSVRGSIQNGWGYQLPELSSKKVN